MASEAAAERTETPGDIDNAIEALETRLGMENPISVTETLYALHLKRSKLARSAGFLDVAKEHFSKLLTLGHIAFCRCNVSTTMTRGKPGEYLC